MLAIGSIDSFLTTLLIILGHFNLLHIPSRFTSSYKSTVLQRSTFTQRRSILIKYVKYLMQIYEHLVIVSDEKCCYLQTEVEINRLWHIQSKARLWYHSHSKPRLEKITDEPSFSHFAKDFNTFSSNSSPQWDLNSIEDYKCTSSICSNLSILGGSFN